MIKKDLPRAVTEGAALNWGLQWLQTVYNYFSVRLNDRPAVGPVSEILLLTHINGGAAFLRATLSWDGKNYRASRELTYGRYFEAIPHAIYFAGACRQFVTTVNADNKPVAPDYGGFPLVGESLNDILSLHRIYNLNRGAKGTDDLLQVVDQFEDRLTKIDDDLQGEQDAVIGGPFDEAYWPKHSRGWVKRFSDECKNGKSD